MAAFKKPFGFQPLDQQIAQRQAEKPLVKGDKYFDHPTAKYVFISLLCVVVVGHIAALIVMAVLGFH